jgi:hypothetical protein
VTPLHVFGLGSIAVAATLVALSALAPRTWYGWNSTPRKLLGRWRIEMGVTGAAILVGTAVALIVVVAPQ